MIVTVEHLRAILSYDKITGRLVWKARDASTFSGNTPLRIIRNWNSRFAGREAFTAVDAAGYHVGTILGRRYYAHRVAMALETGAWPGGEVDHIDGNRRDNRWANLRCVASKDNSRNMGLSRRNTSGYQGVSYCRRRRGWIAQMHLRVPKAIHIHEGPFGCITAAAIARRRLENAHGFHPNHGRQT